MGSTGKKRGYFTVKVVETVGKIEILAAEDVA